MFSYLDADDLQWYVCTKDLQIDLSFSSECNLKQHLVIDYRLGYMFINNGFHVFLKIKESTSIERLKMAQRHNETFKTVQERNSTFRRQFQAAYATNYCDEGNYDLVVNVEEFESPDAIVEHIMQTINLFQVAA